MQFRDIFTTADMDDDTITVTLIENPRDPHLPDFLLRIAGEDGDRSVLLSWDQATRLIMAINEAGRATECGTAGPTIASVTGTITEYPAVDPDGQTHSELAVVRWDGGGTALENVTELRELQPN